MSCVPVRQTSMGDLFGMKFGDAIAMPGVCGTPGKVREFVPKNGEFEVQWSDEPCYYLNDGQEMEGDACAARPDIRKAKKPILKRVSYGSHEMECCFPGMKGPPKGTSCHPKTKDRSYCRDLGKKFCPVHLNPGDPYLKECENWCHHFQEDCHETVEKACNSLIAINTVPMCKTWAEKACDESDSKVCKLYCKNNPSHCKSRGGDVCKDKLLFSNQCNKWCREHPEECNPRRSEYCNRNITTDPFCLKWCMENNGFCDAGMDLYCPMHPDDERCTCFKAKEFPHRCDQACVKSGYKWKDMLKRPCNMTDVREMPVQIQSIQQDLMRKYRTTNPDHPEVMKEMGKLDPRFWRSPMDDPPPFRREAAPSALEATRKYITSTTLGQKIMHPRGRIPALLQQLTEIRMQRDIIMEPQERDRLSKKMLDIQRQIEEELKRQTTQIKQFEPPSRDARTRKAMMMREMMEQLAKASRIRQQAHAIEDQTTHETVLEQLEEAQKQIHDLQEQINALDEQEGKESVYQPDQSMINDVRTQQVQQTSNVDANKAAVETSGAFPEDSTMPDQVSALQKASPPDSSDTPATSTDSESSSAPLEAPEAPDPVKADWGDEDDENAGSKKWIGWVIAIVIIIIIGVAVFFMWKKGIFSSLAQATPSRPDLSHMDFIDLSKSG